MTWKDTFKMCVYVGGGGGAKPENPKTEQTRLEPY